ncbi:hypothetical protein FNV43_RR06477 [Rhamnella rubrinervis]|uniref:Uncharacterized protein n=1 Tax=Rhamnella rubrinervis TaxID=2594499 RepID=A0A8K0MLB9_9ROSA|nr:hypothetical protein FNV43_RR06477 [Rhamnella rubrinervis]
MGSTSKKVSMVMMLVMVALLLMANFVRSHENMNITGNYTDPNHHLHRHRRLGHHQYFDPHSHDHYSKSNNTKKMEGGDPHVDQFPGKCAGVECTPGFNECSLGCFCNIVYDWGKCTGVCCMD